MGPYLRFRFRRLYRRLKKNSGQALPSAHGFFQKHIIRRWRQWQHVRRFTLSWLAIIAISFIGLAQQTANLRDYYETDGPASGGTYVEGIVGEIPSLNPIFPESNVSSAASELLFNGLMRYNGSGELEGDLATSWTVNDDGTLYTVSLRDDVYWHDGAKLSAQDVVFTFTTIQLPDVRSPLRSSWQGVQVNIVDDRTVVFQLPDPYAPFLHSLTTGIIPRHLLENVPQSQLRVSEYNQKPVGTGPFVFSELVKTRGELHFKANERYFRGRPELDKFVLKAVANSDDLLQLYRSGQVVAAGDIEVAHLPEIKKLAETEIRRAPLSSEVFVFFKTTQEMLKDFKVRQALTMATSRQQLYELLGREVVPADAPILTEQAGYSPEAAQKAFNTSEAARLLEEAGWKATADGFREKDGKPLKLRLVTQDDEPYPAIASTLQSEWAKVGVRLEVELTNSQDLQQSYIRPRNYDLLLLGIKIGADPDVYPYWHSSQVRDPGLNLSEYASIAADQALSSGRTRGESDLRAVKYKAFLTAWSNDAPAVVLYRPYYFYVSRTRVFGPRFDRLVDPEDRFYNVEDWTVQTRPTPIRLLGDE